MGRVAEGRVGQPSACPGSIGGAVVGSQLPETVFKLHLLDTIDCGNLNCRARLQTLGMVQTR